jgi:hypothetical protein
MKKYINIIVAVVLLAATSCADQLEQAPANAITTEQIKEILASGDSVKIDLVIGGIANNLPFAIHQNIAAGGADSRINSPLRLQYYNSLLGYDIVCNSAGGGMNFGYEAYLAYSSRRGAVNSTGNWIYWRFGWGCVVAANKLLYYMPEDVNNAKLQDYKARALTLRAFGYNFLMENYRPAYQRDGEGLMIYDKLGGDGAYKSYSTAGETYDFIKEDLNEAVRLFTASQIGENQDGYTANTEDIDLGVANFVLARVSLLTGDDAKAISACNSILAKYPNLILADNYGGKNTGTPATQVGAATSVTPEFIAEDNAFLNFTNNPEVIFGFAKMTNYTNVASEWLNVFGNGYGGTGGNYGRIVSTLYDAINAGDVRKGAFLDGSTEFFEYTHPFSTPIVKTIPPYSNLKWAATSVGGEVKETEIGRFDVCYMRSSEVLLIKAEAQAKSGDEAGAKATLNNLLAARSAGATLTCDNYGMTGSALDMVKLQWRIEMWGENGSEYYNNKRWGNPAIRTRASGHWEDVTIGVDLMTLEIPSDETLYNPNL